ncbi:MAG: TIGR04086 family membrane protein [Clostridium sp.]|nr:TIGR04086 family membrane protein [Clostridium sp.]MCM1444030.1 TIGR04086 family membrane protein [Candidatus Amulumruptor caecigallinarius]
MIDYLKKIGISLIYTFCFLIGLSFIFSILNYINLLGAGIFKFFKMLIPIISIFIGGFILGKKSLSKGWLEGIKYGLIIIFIMVIFSLIFFRTSLSLKSIFYYLILILVSIVSSMLGINFKKNNEV